jgi:hypothetical protein
VQAPKKEDVEALEKNSVKREAVSGELLVSSEVDGRLATAPAVLLAEFPDKLRLELQDPVGGLLVLLVMNGDRFWLFERERSEILTGPVKKIPFPLLPRGSAEDLVRLVLARPYVERLRRGELAGGKVVFREPPLVETVAWDRTHEPTLWAREVAGKKQMSAQYEDYTFQSGLRFPAKLILSGWGSDGKERRATLVWKEWQASVPREKKLFLIPQQQTFGRKIKVLP